MAKVNHQDLCNKIISFQSGKMKKKDIIPFYQDLIDSGLAFALNEYSEKANEYIKKGLCKPAKNDVVITKKTDGSTEVKLKNMELISVKSKKELINKIENEISSLDKEINELKSKKLELITKEIELTKSLRDDYLLAFDEKNKNS